jgi:dTDP-L-rhamnose 4-epimerase
MKNILITGGAGFIGSHLSLYLLRQGFEVTVLDNLSKQVHGDYPEITSPLFKSIKDRVRFIEGDVCRRSSCTEFKLRDFKEINNSNDAVLP